MTSAIVRTNPTSGTATTSSVRDNFGSAADEINRLLRANTDKVESTGTNEIFAQFGNVPTFSLVDGTRVLIQIATTTTSATPTLNVNNTNNVPIKKSDNSDLAIGDLVAGGYYEFVYSSLNNYWLVLNLSAITSQDALLTTILGGLYPVGSLLTTTLATDPGTADYFFSGITFGTWEAYAQGRVSVGVDTGFGTGFVSGDRNESNVTIIIAEKVVSVGDQITVSGFTNDTTANGSWPVTSVVTAAGQTTIVYSSPSVAIIPSLAGTDVKVINESFNAAGEVGGESATTDLIDHEHHVLRNGYQNNGDIGISEYVSEASSNNNGDYLLRPGDSGEPFVGRSSPPISASDPNTSSPTADVITNLQPYITTYIWKRVVTP